MASYEENSQDKENKVEYGGIVQDTRYEEASGCMGEENQACHPNLRDSPETICNGHTSYSNRHAENKTSGNFNKNQVTTNTSVQLSEPDSTIYDSKSSDTSFKAKVKVILGVVAKVMSLFVLLYFFICSLDLLSAAFTLLGGRAAGGALASSPLLSNPVAGLMIGVVFTAFLQSSSTSTSITVTMVAAGLLTVRQAIPMIMGANIGTSVTGVLVSVSQAGDRMTFRRAFAAATVHDMFNWLTVIILLPLEVATGYLYHLTNAIVSSANLEGGGEEHKFLEYLTDPLTNLIVQVDKEVLAKIAIGDPAAANMSLLPYWCKWKSVPADTLTGNQVPLPGDVYKDVIIPEPTRIIGVEPCKYIFHGTSLSEQAVGGIVLVIALAMLLICLILLVRMLKSLLQGQMASVIQKTINADFPGRWACFTGYVTILVGAVVTILVQSSSVVTSALTPMVGVGIVTVERVFPMMLGANIGTTSTAILAAFAATGTSVIPSFQIAMCHLFFNISGILIWYPLPFMRRVPVALAKFLGKTTSQYRWFAVAYLLFMFFLLPLTIFALSIPGWYVLAAVGIPVILLLFIIGIINVLQNRRPTWLPECLRTWDFLPEWMCSLEPLNRQVLRLLACCTCCKCCEKLQASDQGSHPTSIAQNETDNNIPKESDIKHGLSTDDSISFVSSEQNSDANDNNSFFFTGKIAISHISLESSI